MVDTDGEESAQKVPLCTTVYSVHHELMIRGGKAASAGTHEEERGNQTPAVSTAATSIDDGEEAGGKKQRHRVSFPDDYVTTTLQCPHCITVRLTGPYGQDRSWTYLLTSR